jgi:lipopolysaccharide transport system ATP-binding protein
MSDVAIRAEGLGKRYSIGAKPESYHTLRDAIMNIAKAPLRMLSKLGRGSEKDIIWALKDVSFEVKRGEVVGIIGRNGSGKSTLLKILSRITKPTEGRAEIHGRVGSLLEVGTGFHPELTGRENIFLNGSILGMRQREIKAQFDEIVAFAEVEKFLDTPVKRYSSGMRVRLAFAVAAHLEPEILLVDEVLAVGDAQFQKKCLGKMSDVAKEGRTVLFVSHNMAAIQALCGRGMILHEGKIVGMAGARDAVAVYVDSLPQTCLHAFEPIFNETYGIGITGFRAWVDTADDGKNCLHMEVEVAARKLLRRVGVGVELCTRTGARVSLLAPSVTGSSLREIHGTRICQFRCRNITRYVAGGHYLLNVWLSFLGTQTLVRIDSVARIEVPSTDVYGSGVPIREELHGLVPLPVEFSVSRP